VHRLIKGFEELHLPPAVRRIAELAQGMVIVAGITGCGKSTTLAAMIEHINATRRCHIVTIEDPIEYVYDDKLSFINQREVGIDVDDFQTALKYVVRQDPDVILIGEMRDRETIESAMAAAETGHLVFGTLHTSTAPQTLDRVLSFFPRERHRLIRHSLAFNLKAIICQVLLPSCRENVDRVPAVEIMLVTPIVRKLILDGDDERLPDAIRIGREEGMQDFTESLRQLVADVLVDRQVAFERAPNVEALKMAIKGIIGGETSLLGGT
jgi:twitching motility protein PilT